MSMMPKSSGYMFSPRPCPKVEDSITDYTDVSGPKVADLPTVNVVPKQYLLVRGVPLDLPLVELKSLEPFRWSETIDPLALCEGDNSPAIVLPVCKIAREILLACSPIHAKTSSFQFKMCFSGARTAQKSYTRKALARAKPRLPALPLEYGKTERLHFHGCPCCTNLITGTTPEKCSGDICLHSIKVKYFLQLFAAHYCESLVRSTFAVFGKVVETRILPDGTLVLTFDSRLAVENVLLQPKISARMEPCKSLFSDRLDVAPCEVGFACGNLQLAKNSPKPDSVNNTVGTKPAFIFTTTAGSGSGEPAGCFPTPAGAGMPSAPDGIPTDRAGPNVDPGVSYRGSPSRSPPDNPLKAPDSPQRVGELPTTNLISPANCLLVYGIPPEYPVELLYDMEPFHWAKSIGALHLWSGSTETAVVLPVCCSARRTLLTLNQLKVETETEDFMLNFVASGKVDYSDAHVDVKIESEDIRSAKPYLSIPPGHSCPMCEEIDSSITSGCELLLLRGGDRACPGDCDSDRNRVESFLFDFNATCRHRIVVKDIPNVVPLLALRNTFAVFGIVNEVLGLANSDVIVSYEAPDSVQRVFSQLDKQRQGIRLLDPIDQSEYLTHVVHPCRRDAIPLWRRLQLWNPRGPFDSDPSSGSPFGESVPTASPVRLRRWRSWYWSPRGGEVTILAGKGKGPSKSGKGKDPSTSSGVTDLERTRAESNISFDFRSNTRGRSSTDPPVPGPTKVQSVSQESQGKLVKTEVIDVVEESLLIDTDSAIQRGCPRPRETEANRPSDQAPRFGITDIENEQLLNESRELDETIRKLNDRLEVPLPVKFQPDAVPHSRQERSLQQLREQNLAISNKLVKMTENAEKTTRMLQEITTDPGSVVAARNAERAEICVRLANLLGMTGLKDGRNWSTDTRSLETFASHILSLLNRFSAAYVAVKSHVREAHPALPK